MSERMENLEFATNALHNLSAELGRGLIGNELQRSLTVASLAVKQHVLFEGEPGTGKTELAKRMAAATGLRYGRIQGVADLTPADVIGYEMPKINGGSETHLGPIHNDIVLVDELNRMNTKAQGALNQSLAESKVTIGSKQYALNHDKPFMVLATQNEHALGQGTFPVSDALYDRFGMVVPFHEPSTDDRKSALRNFVLSRDVTGQIDMQQVVDEKDIARSTEAVLAVNVDEASLDFLARLPEIIRAQQNDDDIRVRGGYRAPQATVRLAQANALMDGRAYVTTEDIARIAPYAWGHRLSLDLDASVEDRQSIVRQAAETAV